MSNLIPSGPEFSRGVTTDHQCIPCITSSMHEGHVRGLPVRGLPKGKPEEADIHYNLSGPLKESLSKNTYALHLLDSRINLFSELHARTSKDKVPNIALGFINKVNKIFFSQGAMAGMIRVENGR